MAKKKVLLIDDEVNYGKMVKINLEDTGLFEVEVASKGSQGIGLAREFKPDLVLLDIIMPDMPGPTVAGMFKKDPDLKHIPVAYLTATITKEEQKASKTGTIGEYPFIAKPVSIEELIKFIQGIIG